MISYGLNMNAQKIKKISEKAEFALNKSGRKKKIRKTVIIRELKQTKQKQKKKQSKILGLSLNSMLLEQHKKEADLFQTIDNRLQLAFTC